jgi:hypothetical protein
MENYTQEDSTFPSTNDDDRVMLVGYDLSIKREMDGASPGGSVHSWIDFWTKILHYLSEKDASGAYVIHNHDRYMNYIINRRRQAGLPDIPGYH